MRSLHAILPAALVGCLLSAPVAFASDGEDTPLNLPSAGGGAAKASAHSATSGGSIVRTILGLGAVLGVIYGLHWLLKKVKASKDNSSSGESLETIATLSLGTNRSLHLVRVGGEIVLLGAAEHQITPIRRYSESEAHSLGLLEPPPLTLESLEVPAAKPKGFMETLRSKTVIR
jgi:flagellar protein FliO/FliZ